jgi:hypothetical protein
MILDDMRERHDEFHRVLANNVVPESDVYHAYSEDSALRALSRCYYDVVCLDNDLNDEYHGGDLPPGYWAGEGIEVAKFISYRRDDQKPRLVLVHSHNAQRAFEMGELLEKSLVKAIVRPYSFPMNWFSNILKCIQRER